MKLSQLSAAAVAVCLGLGMTGARADVTLLSEGFEDVSALSGWVLLNNSSPVGPVSNWYQGSSGVFSAQAGTIDSFLAGNYNLAAAGGTMDAWVITPTFSTESAVTVSFYLRAEQTLGYFDTVQFGTSTGSSTPGSFTLNPTQVVPAGGGWNLYTVNVAAGGTGSVARFAIHYTGLGDDSNYLGIDTLSISAVPEPASALLLAAGVAGLGALRRRRAQA